VERRAAPHANFEYGSCFQRQSHFIREAEEASRIGFGARSGADGRACCIHGEIPSHEMAVKLPWPRTAETRESMAFEETVTQASRLLRGVHQA
jgi:hypothetical protein